MAVGVADCFTSAKIVKDNVKVNGINTVQISAQIEGNILNESFERYGMGDLDSSSDSDFSEIEPIKATIWIDKKTYLPVKTTTDMAAFYNGYFKSMYEAMGAESDMSYSTAKSTITYKNFNKATKFKFPDFSK